MPVLTPQPGETHDIIFQLGVGGSVIGFMHNPSRFAEVRVNDFAPNLATGTAPRYATGAFQVFAPADFSHGVDNLNHDDGDQSAYRTDGNIFLKRNDFISLNARWVTADLAAGNATCPLIVDFQDFSTFGWVCMGVGVKIRKSTDGDTWSNENNNGSDLGGNVTELTVYDKKLYLCLAGSNYVVWDGVAASGMVNPATGTSTKTFLFMVFFRESLVAAIDDDLWISTDGDNWTSLYEDIGDPGTAITKLWAAEDFMVIGKPEGLFTYDSKAASGNELTQIWHNPPLSTINFNMGTTWRGASYTNMLRETFKVAIQGGVNFTPVTPFMKGTADRELYGHGIPFVAVPGPFDLFVGYHTGEGPTNDFAEVLAYDGVGHHQELRSAAGEGPLNALGYSRIAGYLLCNYNSNTVRRKLIDLSNLPAADDFAASGQVITSWEGGGLPNMLKAWRDITLVTRDCTSTEKITIEYEIDDSGSWVTVGDVVQSPRQKLTLKGVIGPVLAKKIRFRFTLARDSGDDTLSPRIKLPPVYELSVLPLPPPMYSRTYTLLLGDDVPLRPPYGSEQTGPAGAWDNPFDMAKQLNFLDQMQRTGEDLIEWDEGGQRKRVRMTDRAKSQPVRWVDGRREGQAVITLLDMYNDLSATLIEEVGVSDDVSTSALRTAATGLFFDGLWGLGLETFKNDPS